MSKDAIQRMAIAFADDTNFYVNRPNYEIKIQIIKDLCTKLYEETGGKTQQIKLNSIISSRSMRSDCKT